MRSQLLMRLTLVVIGTLICSFSAIVGGVDGMLRTGVLALFTLLTLTLFLQYDIRRWWMFLLGGGISGFLAGILMYYYCIITESTIYMPYYIQIYTATGYGTLMLCCFNWLRDRKIWLRWTGMLLAVSVVYVLSYFPLIIRELGIAIGLFFMSANGMVYGIFWMSFALMIEHAVESDFLTMIKKGFSKILILYIPLIGFTVYGAGIGFLMINGKWMKCRNDNESIRLHLKGYITSDRETYDLTTGKIIVFYDKEIEKIKEDEKRKIAQVVGELPRRVNIRGYAYSSDKKYIAVIYRSPYFIMEMENLLVIYEVGYPEKKGLYIGDIQGWGGIEWLEKMPEKVEAKNE